MAQATALPLIGRLALQLKLLSQDQLKQAMAHAAQSGNPQLGHVFVDLGFIDPAQLQKLEQVQRDVIAKHRAKRAAAGGEAGAGAPAPPAAAPAAAQAPQRSKEQVLAAAAHAAQAASPMTGADVDALREAPPVEAPAKPAAASAPAPRAAAPSAPLQAAPSPARAPAPPAPPRQEKAPAIAIEDDDGLTPLNLALPEPTAEDRANLENLVRRGVGASASDIHIHSGGPAKQRVAGQLLDATDGPIDRETATRMVCAALTPEQRRILAIRGELDFCLVIDGLGRFRCNAYCQQRGIDLSMRTIPSEPPTLASLGLPQELAKYTDYHQGMVLITGPAGCGKSSTLAALVNLINEKRQDHILCVEDPIETLHPSKNCLVNQRHAGSHTASFARALRGALREDPDVIVIGELRDLETISLAMTAAETGHFVLATLHTSNAVRTINRMIGAFPSNQQDQVRTMLSESLRAVVSQRLVPLADGSGRVPALELLVINKAIANLIRDEKTVQIRSSIQTGKAHGMYLLEQSLNDLVAAGKITREAALSLSEDEKLITAGR